MPTWILKYLFWGLASAAAAGVIWYGIDSVAAAFRERKQLRYDLDRATAETQKAQAEREAAAAQAQALERRNAAEIKARDDAAKAAASREAKIHKELTNAKSRLAQWESGADEDLARCLRLPVPGWLLSGAGEADPAARLLQADPAAR